MAEYVFSDKHLVSRFKSHKKRRDISEPISMQSVPAYQLPQELIEVLKQNVSEYPGISEKGMEWLTYLKSLPKIKDVQKTNYLRTLRLLLYLEDYYNEEERDLFILRNQMIRRSEDSLDHFVIKVPGLAEDHLIPTDVIEAQDPWNLQKYNLEVTFIVQNYVTVKAESEFLNVYVEGLRFDIMFQRSNWPIRACHFALKMINSSSLAPLLQPVTGEYLNKPKKDLFWFDENIKNNPEQMQAVQRILGRTACPSPYLVFGPPGTGKTATIVEAISQIWKSDPLKSRILVCTPSNAAADEIARRLLRNISQYLICRMNSPSRDTRDLDESIRGCSHFLLTKELLIRKKIIIMTLITCVRLVRMDFWQNHFGYIFIDEAAQATQPETLIPLGLMSPENKGFIGRFNGQLIFSGDPKQLGPIVNTKIGPHLLGKSMLERLMDCVQLYQKGEGGNYDPNFITKLVKNYRSHEAILRIPNQMFYENELVSCGGKEIFRAEYWSKLPNKKFPLIFHAVHGLERRDENSPSVYNQYEVDVVMEYVKKLMGESLGAHTIEENDIGIITPFKFQASVIKKALQKKGWDNISVGTVEIFQGQEKDIIIISTVRSVIFQHNEKFHIGFLSNDKRFNVTLTRAKCLLIVIGNPKVLQIDPCWREFIEYCQKNKACEGDKFTLSRLTEDEMKKLLNNKLESEDCKPKFLRPKEKIENIEDVEEIPLSITNGTLETKLDADFSTTITANCLSIEERFAASLKLGETLNEWW